MLNQPTSEGNLASRGVLAWASAGLLAGALLGTATALFVGYWMPALPPWVKVMVAVAGTVSGTLAAVLADLARQGGSGILGVLAALLAVPVVGFCLIDVLGVLAFVVGFRGFGAGGGPVARSLPMTTSSQTQSLNLTLLEETLRDDSPQTVFYTWQGGGPLNEVELIVKVESDGRMLEVRRSWPSWKEGETKAVELPARADGKRPVLSGTAIFKGQKSQLAAMRPAK